MAKTVRANRAQVRAAQLIVSRASRGMGMAGPAVRAIANAKPVRANERAQPQTAATATDA